MPHRKLKEFSKRWSAEDRVKRGNKETLEAMYLEELRKAREMTQAKLAETLGVAQSEISKIEHRADLYISTLTQYVTALGGTLEIRALFPEGDVRISQFENLSKIA
jgi:transcriptional regulator with XRE-family HTH domain